MNETSMSTGHMRFTKGGKGDWIASSKRLTDDRDCVLVQGMTIYELSSAQWVYRALRDLVPCGVDEDELDYGSRLVKHIRTGEGS